MVIAFLMWLSTKTYSKVPLFKQFSANNLRKLYYKGCSYHNLLRIEHGGLRGVKEIFFSKSDQKFVKVNEIFLGVSSTRPVP